ncbi:MAG: hypothetical protein IJ677_01220 [Alphaproteobacteria bacterium]|nr:hypothetical protein [Alphaproteobacteria bacterium]
MKRFDFLLILAMLFYIALVGITCAVAKSAWYVWCVVLAVNIAGIYIDVRSEKPTKELSEHEQHLRCARISWNTAGVVGLTAIVLGVMDGVFGNVVIIVISLSIIWLCMVHFADKKGKILWWLGWVITMCLAIVAAILCILSNSGIDILPWIMGVLFIMFLISAAITLIVGVILYVYPPIKELSEDVKEIHDAIKSSGLKN